jgi:hypothetical protein
MIFVICWSYGIILRQIVNATVTSVSEEVILYSGMDVKIELVNSSTRLKVQLNCIRT